MVRSPAKQKSCLGLREREEKYFSNVEFGD